jgi:hydroxypyruvate isomerase
MRQWVTGIGATVVWPQWRDASARTAYTWQARRIIERVGASNLLLHPDSCHTPMLKGNLADTIRENAVIIGRFQIAGLPGRHERVNNRETCVILAL